MPARVRSYRADGRLARSTFGFAPADSVRSTAAELFHQLRGWTVDELGHPRHENIRWLTRDVVPA
jgi:hypothetical protein